ncbi:hypothetical protein SAMN05421640_1506 [Ekhidna lutea]|uniref:Uncharacterized protein n=1 Tax=Ekhidna lutea TaxID=447679 RepID=A0A239HTV9_EKHLU|nr:hypothetical protein SAMN05421640_1506 [Ekhidna lutea]
MKIFELNLKQQKFIFNAFIISLGICIIMLSIAAF